MSDDPSLKDIYQKLLELEHRLSTLEAEFRLIKRICLVILGAIASLFGISLNHIV